VVAVEMTDWNSWFARIRLGRWMDTMQMVWAPFHGQHWFIAGETGYGKSNTERVIVKELLPGIHAGAVEIIGFDAQLGVELQPLHDAGLLKEFHFGSEAGRKTAEYPDGIPYEATFADALERHVNEMRERTLWMKKMGVNEFTITKTDPGRVILIDEAGQMFRAHVEKRIRDRVLGLIETLTMQSRKCGYTVVACTQLANVESVPIRHGLTFGVAHRMQTPLGYYQVTRNSMDMPALPRKQLSEHDPAQGLFYMSGHNKRVGKTQYIPTERLKPMQEPVIVNSARIPKLEEMDRIPVYADQIGTVDTLTGEVVDSDDQYRSEYERFRQWSEYQ